MMHVHVIVPWLITNCFMMLLILVLIISSIHVTSSDSPHYMNKDCQGKSAYISGSDFEANLNDTLFTQLLPKASTVKFLNYTIGSGVDQVYGLFYCKGDVDEQTCQDCIEAATKKIKYVCDFLKEGIVWFEECTLRYANRNIFSTGEEKPYFPYINKTGIVNDFLLDQYKEKFDSAMNSLIQEAANDKGTLQGFATKEFNLSASEIIRGLAQCTPDIVGTGCSTCLTTALRLRDSWANTMVFLPSCLLRYDLYATVSTPPPASSASPHTQGFHIALIVVLSVVFIVLAVIGGPWLWKRCLKGRKSTGRVSDHKLKNSPDVQPRNLVADIGDRVQGLPRYTFPQIEQMTEGFKKQLGTGGFGVVYYGRLLDNSSREVAVKVLNENDAPKQFSNEINVFVRISHNNLVSLLGYCEDGNRLALIYEFMNKGDLNGLLSDKSSSLSWTDRLKIAIDTAEGLHYLHRHCEDRIVHRDVKPANILLNQNLQAKVADFGLSKIFPEKDVTTLKTRVITTPGYTAPEYFTTGLLNEKADVYSFGVVLLELITGQTPSSDFNLIEWFLNLFNKGDIEKVLDSKMTRNIEHTKQVLDNSSVWRVSEIAKSCIQTDETKRPTMWNVVVRLKDCLDKDVKKNAGTSRTGPTSMEMTGPVIPKSIAMEPEAT